jgi:AcrR family transcriptional regulator
MVTSMVLDATATTTDRPPAPRKRDAERTRASLMKAALKEFSQHGYAGARIDQIAKSAKCNIRMLYHYFGDKKGLYVAVLEAAYADLRRKEAGLAIDLEQPLEGILELMRFTFLYFQENPLFEGLIRAENMMQGKFVSRSKPVPEAASTLKQTLKALIASGQARGLFREPLDPVQVYVTITALSRFHLANAYSMSAVLGADLRDKAWREARLAHSCELLRAYLRKDGASAVDEVPGELVVTANEGAEVEGRQPAVPHHEASADEGVQG